VKQAEGTQMIRLAVIITLTPSLALAQPLPQPKPTGPGGSCPHGYSSSGSFCVPREAHRTRSRCRRTGPARTDGRAAAATACAAAVGADPIACGRLRAGSLAHRAGIGAERDRHRPICHAPRLARCDRRRRVAENLLIRDGALRRRDEADFPALWDGALRVQQVR
jgi:hypothetical protein